MRGKCKVVAVSDTYKLAPWADCLVSADASWWAHNPEATLFDGKKFGTMPDFQQVPGVERLGLLNGANSGLVGLHVAVMQGATKVLLCGFDMGGTHYFGPHPAPLKNTTAERFEAFKRQFARFKPKGVEIVNCTDNSALKSYPFAKLEDMLC